MMPESGERIGSEGCFEKCVESEKETGGGVALGRGGKLGQERV
jgi:hypothetical protein